MRLRRGFLLVDVTVAIALTGLAIVGCLYLMASSTSTNRQMGLTSQAMSVAEGAMNYVASFPLVDESNQYGSTGTPNDISDFDNRTFPVAIGSDGIALPKAGNWSQRVSVQSFDLDAPNTLAAASAVNARLVTVTAVHAGEDAYSFSRVFAPTVPW